MKLILSPGSTSVIVHIFVPDSTSTTGAGKTGLVFGNFTVYYVRAGGTLTALTPQDIAILGTYAAPTLNTNIRIKLLSDANAPGLYEVQLHNDNLLAGANQITYMFRAAGAAPTLMEIQLHDVWDEILAAHLGAGGAGAALNALAPGGAIVLNAEITEIHTT